MKPIDRLYQMDVNTLFHPVAIQKKHEAKGPRIIVKGNGLWIEDIHGKKYLDAVSSLWNVIIGHVEKSVIDAMHEQAGARNGNRGIHNIRAQGWLGSKVSY